MAVIEKNWSVSVSNANSWVNIDEYSMRHEWNVYPYGSRYYINSPTPSDAYVSVC